MKKKIAYQFKIELLGIEPLIWRAIEVPSYYTFWDLHVAIQDSMGWLDYHLHSFTISQNNNTKPIVIGIPDTEYEDSTLSGWEVALTDIFNVPGDEALYAYDFGDDWHHRVILETVSIQKSENKYPNCIDGKRACPPEDSGGVYGYNDMLNILSNEKHEEYKNIVYWLSNHAKNYHPYDAEHFKSKEIKFSNPKERWKIAFEN